MTIKRLKRDIFGEVHYRSGEDAKRRWQELGLQGECPEEFSERNIRNTRLVWRFLAWRLAAREARVLDYLPRCDQVPQLLAWEQGALIRSWISGQPMQLGKPTSPQYFADAQRLLFTLHKNNVVHNDLAKEPNWLVMDDGRPALIDYQLAWHSRRRRGLFCTLGKEDIRHMLKHKRTYGEPLLTDRERAILATPAITSRAWMSTVKPVYLFVTRRLLKWSDREGAGDRNL